MSIWLTIEESAMRLKMGKSMVQQMARHDKAPTQEVRRAWRFDLEDLDVWLKSG